VLIKFMRLNRSGVTMVEAAVAIGVFSLLSLAIGWIVIISSRTNSTVSDQLRSQGDMRRTLREVVDTVRKAETSSLGAYPLAVAGSYELAVYANIDGDSLKERVRFWLDGRTLKRGLTEPAGNPLGYSGAESVVELAHDVINQEQSTPLFLYFDESYTGTQAALAQPVSSTAVRLIKMQLDLERDPAKSPVPLHGESLVQIRNTKNN